MHPAMKEMADITNRAGVKWRALSESEKTRWANGPMKSKKTGKKLNGWMQFLDAERRKAGGARA